jgi:hypothetical protein
VKQTALVCFGHAGIAKQREEHQEAEHNQIENSKREMLFENSVNLRF